jgi:hypothetical protein
MDGGGHARHQRMIPDRTRVVTSGRASDRALKLGGTYTKAVSFQSILLDFPEAFDGVKGKKKWGVIPGAVQYGTVLCHILSIFLSFFLSPPFIIAVTCKVPSSSSTLQSPFPEWGRMARVISWLVARVLWTHLT